MAARRHLLRILRTASRRVVSPNGPLTLERDFSTHSSCCCDNVAPVGWQARKHRVSSPGLFSAFHAESPNDSKMRWWPLVAAIGAGFSVWAMLGPFPHWNAAGGPTKLHVFTHSESIAPAGILAEPLEVSVSEPEPANPPLSEHQRVRPETIAGTQSRSPGLPSMQIMIEPTTGGSLTARPSAASGAHARKLRRHTRMDGAGRHYGAGQFGYNSWGQRGSNGRRNAGCPLCTPG